MMSCCLQDDGMDQGSCKALTAHPVVMPHLLLALQCHGKRLSGIRGSFWGMGWDSQLLYTTQNSTQNSTGSSTIHICSNLARAGNLSYVAVYSASICMGIKKEIPCKRGRMGWLWTGVRLCAISE